MSVDEPDFMAFLTHLMSNMGKEALNSMLTPDYLIDFRNRNLPVKLGNLLSVMSCSQSEMATILEKDLKGGFSETSIKFLDDTHFNFAGEKFDKYVITPLIMDFKTNKTNEKVHYNYKPQKDAFSYADNLLSQIKVFYEENPNTLIEILPFAGLTPPAYSLEQVQQWLMTYFYNFTATKEDQNRRSPRFYGIKLYPPLGVEPWPEDAKEREKIELIYSFAQEHRIPITTHCDDEGYRVDVAEVTQVNTSPEIWNKVLENYPKLKLNFAHFGNQYHRNKFFMKQEQWRDNIIDMMSRYDNVYADVSFNGVTPEYYTILQAKLQKLDGELCEILMKRLMFGSDFSIHLSKVSSYNQYIEFFESSALRKFDKINMAQRNCESFLFE